MRWGIAVVLVLACGAAWAAAPFVKWRALTAEEAKQVAALLARLDRHATAGEFEQTARVAEQVAAFRRQRQGDAHWEAIDARYEAREWRRMAGAAASDRAETMRARKRGVEGIRLLNLGRYREAEKPLRESLALWEKAVGEGNPRTAAMRNNLAYCLDAQGKTSEALPLFRKALAAFRKTLGEEHPQTTAASNNVAYALQGQGKAADALPLYRKALAAQERILGGGDPATAVAYNNVAYCLQDLGEHAEALPLYRKALWIREKALGEGNADTAASCNNVGDCLRRLGRHAEALPLHRRALAIHEKVLGQDHPDIANSYSGVAACLSAQGKRAEALALSKKALAVREKALGEDHPRTAISYDSVALCLQEQGRAGEALPLLQKALRIKEKALGEHHPDTADSYNSVAYCLNAQGRHAEALPLYRKALAVREKALGENHPDTAISYNNVAACLLAQRRSAEALPLFRRALAIHERNLGAAHPDTAAGYSNVAACLNALGKHDQALPLLRKALATFKKTLGESHPRTAAGYHNVAACLSWLARNAEALPLFRRALAIHEEALGAGHPDTAAMCDGVASCLWEQGRRNEAVRLLQLSLPGREAARALRADSGFDRAQAVTTPSTRRALAVELASLGQPRNAFAHAEASLARGLLDDTAVLSAEEGSRFGALRTRLASLERTLAPLAGREGLNDEQRDRYARARRDYARTWGALSDLHAAASARLVSPLGHIQKAIPPDAALVLWIDTKWSGHWACVVRREGAPAWVRLQGTGKGGDWTKDDLSLAFRLYQSLIDPHTSAPDRRELLAAFRRQWFDPLRPQLKGVKRLFVVPTGPISCVPADLIADGFSVSYVPSGSVLARLAENHRPVDGSSLLALGDPAFDRPPPPETPGSGVLVLSVLPGSHAATAGLRPGDVILAIAGVAIGSLDDVEAALKEAPGSLAYWREGRRFKGNLPGTPLGAVLDPRSVKAALRAWRRDQEARAPRGTGHKPLPGTRLEVEAIAPLFRKRTTLLGGDASEQRLDELIDKAELKNARVVHIATHGELVPLVPSRSALVLAQDRLPDPLAQVHANKHPYDGRLTVARIRERWELDADLVVLSACETGLGLDAGGEGLLGFAHAFLSKGARSVVLSRWKVDDLATALLMVRFYENLLGKRKGLAKPMGRAAAIDEAKRWLRELPRNQAGAFAALYASGELRGSVAPGKPAANAKVPAKLPEGDRPFAHPFYWAAFTLLGDPD